MKTNLDEKYLVFIRKINSHLSGLEQKVEKEIETKQINFPKKINEAFTLNYELKDFIDKYLNLLNVFLKELNIVNEFSIENEFDGLLNSLEITTDTINILRKKFKELLSISSDIRESKKNLLNLNLVIHEEAINKRYKQDKYKKSLKYYYDGLNEMKNELTTLNKFSDDRLMDTQINDFKNLENLPIKIKKRNIFNNNWFYLTIFIFIISITLIAIGIWMIVV